MFESLLGYRGHSLIGKTTELQSVNSGSRPDISKAHVTQSGRVKYWSYFCTSSNLVVGIEAQGNLPLGTKRNFSIMVIRMTFNHYDIGSNPVNSKLD